jgi:hypothetical protein
MGYFSYKIEHDYGLAPNPFGGFCTIAVCKPTIRANKNLHIGDWIFGTGSAKLKNLNHLIFAMKVEEILLLENYWDDERFQYKKPVVNGSLVQMYGDNFYHKKKSGKWVQENSAHSLEGGKVNKKHLEVDTDGKNVLISKSFYYFGDKAITIPEPFREICNKGRNMKSSSIPVTVADKFIQWLQAKHEVGIHGDPIDWKKHLT